MIMKTSQIVPAIMRALLLKSRPSPIRLMLSKILAKVIADENNTPPQISSR
jgi:hypothetical protein